jgi:hypothetical protein
MFCQSARRVNSVRKQVDPEQNQQVEGKECPKCDDQASRECMAVRHFVNAGERFEPVVLPTGRDDVDTVLRAYLATDAGQSPSELLW